MVGGWMDTRSESMVMCLNGCIHLTIRVHGKKPSEDLRYHLFTVAANHSLHFITAQLVSVPHSPNIQSLAVARAIALAMASYLGWGKSTAAGNLMI